MYEYADKTHSFYVHYTLYTVYDKRTRIIVVIIMQLSCTLYSAMTFLKTDVCFFFVCLKKCI